MASLGLVFSRHTSQQIAFISNSFINCLLRLIVSEFKSTFLLGQNYRMGDYKFLTWFNCSQQFSYWMSIYTHNFMFTNCLRIITSWIMVFLDLFIITFSPMHRSTRTHTVMPLYCRIVQEKRKCLSPMAQLLVCIPGVGTGELSLELASPPRTPGLGQEDGLQVFNIDASLASLQTPFHNVFRAPMESSTTLFNTSIILSQSQTSQSSIYPTPQPELLNLEVYRMGFNGCTLPCESLTLSPGFLKVPESSLTPTLFLHWVSVLLYILMLTCNSVCPSLPWRYSRCRTWILSSMSSNTKQSTTNPEMSFAFVVFENVFNILDNLWRVIKGHFPHSKMNKLSPFSYDFFVPLRVSFSTLFATCYFTFFLCPQTIETCLLPMWNN